MLPELARDFGGVDACSVPPCPLVAGAMDGAVMGAAKGHGEFVAGFPAERAWLRMPQMVRVRWLAAADEAWLLSDIA